MAGMPIRKLRRLGYDIPKTGKSYTAEQLPEIPRAPRPQHATVLAALRAQDDVLVKAGWPPISPWWWNVLERFYESGRRQLVLRVGRRGGKSSTLCRVAVAEVLHGGHAIPPGDAGMFAFVSVKRTEARERLRTIRAILDALGEKYDERGDEVALRFDPYVFRVFTATMSGVVGPTCVGAVCDEVAKWHDDDTGANPATEVLNSLRPTLLTQPRAHMFLSSSPLGELDAHAQAYRQGNDARQLVMHAETWVANPTVTEAQTHTEEPNEDVWRREYAAIPMEGTEESLISAVLLDSAQRIKPGDVPRETGVTYNAAMDPALVRNAWTLAVCARRWVDGKIKRTVVATREWRGTQGTPLRPDAVLAEVARVLRGYDLDVVDTDEFHGQSLAVIAEQPHINLVVRIHPTSAKDKIERYESLLTQLSDGVVELPCEPRVRADLLAVRRLLTPNGFVIRLPETPDGRHCDHASAISLGLERCLVDPEVARPRPYSPEWRADREAAEAARLADLERRLEEQTDRELEEQEREEREQW
jgi:hypothetical protein